MNNIKKRLISMLICVIVFLSWTQPVFAEDYYNTTGYFDRLLLGIVHGTSSIPLIGDAVQGIAGGLVGDICSGSDDGLHHATEFVDGTLRQKNGLNYALGICSYCGKQFEIYGADVKTAYDNYVSTLPATGYDSTGGLLWSLEHDYSYIRWGSSTPAQFYYCEHSSLGSSTIESNFSHFFNCANNSVRIVPVSGKPSFSGVSVRFYYKGTVPVEGFYTRLSSPAIQGYYSYNGSSTSLDKNWNGSSSPVFYALGDSISLDIFTGNKVTDGISGAFLLVQGFAPVYKVTPSSALSSDTYNINTRPTSITGGNYGIVGDNGQITKVEDNSTIISETNNTYYNPATGQTVPIIGWTYDYSDRSYKVTMEGGKTSTVTYGDENISITETTVNESGDTITNNYTIYYLVDGSGSENPPAACEHTWAETSSTAPTCTVPGSKLSTCSKCQQTKKEAIPALGHDWQVKKSVTTEYDETGQLTQQGYTIFECSRCHEQYKSTDGTIPPGGGSGTDPGEEGGTTIGGLIEKLLSGVGSIVGGIIKGLLSLLTKAVEALAGLAELFTTFVSSLVDLWGGFTSFLSAVFPFLPEEFIIIIELGLILVIAAAVFRKFIS